MTTYRDLLTKIRLAFPQPVSDRVHDSYFVHSMMRALDQVDTLKTELPTLGIAPPNDYAAAEDCRLRPHLGTVEDVTTELVGYLKGMTIFGHPRTQQNVTPPPSIPSLIGVLLASLYNPNLGWDEYSRRVALAEVEATAITADLVGYDATKAGGVFTFGGTGTNLYGVKLGIEKAIPGAMLNGVGDGAVLFASDVSHYCRFNIAGWLGLGVKNIEVIPTGADNAIDVRILAERARAVLREGRKIAAFIATMGSTDAFGLDDLEAIVRLRDELVKEFRLPYAPQVHADAVIGWAWSVFKDYSWERNPLAFRPRTIRALAGIDRKMAHLHRADSVGIDFHKTGFCPYIASLFLTKDRNDFALLARDPAMMPYLFHSGEYKPGFFTLETSRSGTGILAALANLRLLGVEGWQALLGHIIEMTQLLREHLDGHESTTVLNRANFGPVTLFRVYPDEIDTFTVQEREFNDPAYRTHLLRHNEYNRRIAAYVHGEAMAGRGIVISMTECYRRTSYGEPIVALKSYILSPFVDEVNVEVLVNKIIEARAHVEMPA
ncbi:MAG: pyridoxal-dependent decarboxylase [Planctomycetota bacterium]